MALNSVNTNTAASIALASLELTSSQLQGVQKQISTGYRVADATDDGAAYAIAQRVRSDVGALTSANNQLNNSQGLISTTLSALNDVSNTLGSARDVLVALADSSTQGSQRSQYIAQYQSLITNIASFVKDADYNGRTLIGNIKANQSYTNLVSGASSITGTTGFANIAVIRNEVGATFGISTFGGAEFLGSIAFGTGSAALGSATYVQSLITTTGTFLNQLTAIGNALNKFGSASDYVTNQVTYNTTKITSLNNGVGSLVDADLAQESAALQSLQIRQQLGTQALSIANQAPQSLLSLFK